MLQTHVVTPWETFTVSQGRRFFKEAEDLYPCRWTGLQFKMLRYMASVTELQYTNLLPLRSTMNVSKEANRDELPWHFLPNVTDQGSPVSHFLQVTVILFQWHVFYLMKRRNKHFLVLFLKRINLKSLDSLKIITILESY